MNSKQRAWVFFFLLAAIWGSSFLLMRVAVVEMPPAQLTFTRVGIAALGMNLALWLTGRRYPSDWRTLRDLAIIGFGNTALPFTLLAWGEQTVESGMTSILQASAPIFALVIAHFAFTDERMNPLKVMGVALSFAGIVALTSRDWTEGGLVLGDLTGELAIVGAALCYAIFTTFSRKVLQNRGVEPVVVAAMTMTSAALCAGAMMLAGPVVGERAPVSYAGLSVNVLLSGVVLGVLNTFIAYLMFYTVVKELGASRTTMVTYVVPVVAVTLGALVLNERIDASLLVGAALIMGGIGLVNLRPRFNWGRRSRLAVSQTK